MLIIAGTITIDPDHRDEMLDAVRPMVVASLAEAGCQEYAFTADPNDPALIRLFELWDSEEALAAHGASDHMAAWRKRSSGLPVTGRDLRKFTISDVGSLG